MDKQLRCVPPVLSRILLVYALWAAVALIGCSSSGGSSGSGGSNGSSAPAIVNFNVVPGGGTGGTAFPTQPVVAIEDATGNVVTSSSAAVTLSISSGPTGGVLSCTNNPQTATAGIATFSGCKINLVGNYTLEATALGISSIPTGCCTVINLGPAVQMAFTVQPSSVAPGMPISPAVQVAVEDAGGNIQTGVTGVNAAQITMTIKNNPANGTLGGVTQVDTSNGVATFSDLTINNIGAGYTLAASSSFGLLFSSSFNVTNSLPASCSDFSSGSESLVTGHWAALVQGWNVAADAPNASVFAFDTNGAGGFVDQGGGVAGDMDFQAGQGGASSYTYYAIESSGSSYVIGKDPTGSGYIGCMTLATINPSTNAAGPTSHFFFTLGGISGGSASKGSIIRWDNTTGTTGNQQGIMLPQDSSQFSIGDLQASYAAGLSGVNPSGTPYATAASVTLNTGTGAISGVADIDNAGTGCIDTSVTGGTAATATTSLTGRLTGSITPACTGTASDRVLYIVNTNELFILTTDPFTGSVPILSGRAIVQTGHGSFNGSSVSGNYLFHETGISTTANGSACSGDTVNCAAVNLGVVTASSTGTDTLNFNGASWQYQPGNTVTTNTIVNQAGTVDTNWGRIVLTSSAGNTDIPVIYLASPVTGADATEPYVGFLVGSGACNSGTPPCTSSLLDPTAPLGFLETGASTNLSTASAADDYFIGEEDPGDVAEGSEAGVVDIVASGVITGTSYTSSSSGLEENSISGSLTIDNADPNGTTFAFPGLGNIGAGSFGVTNGTRFIFFTTGSPYGSDGVNGAVIMVADQLQ